MPLSCPSAVSLRDSAVRDSQSLQCSENRDRRTICGQRTELPETARLHSLWSTTKRQKTSEKLAVRPPAATPVQKQSLAPGCTRRPPRAVHPCPPLPQVGGFPRGPTITGQSSATGRIGAVGTYRATRSVGLGGWEKRRETAQHDLTPTGYYRGVPQRLACLPSFSFPFFTGESVLHSGA